MSSILEALKKLEKENEEKEPQQFNWPQPVDTRSSFSDSLKERLSRNIFISKAALIFFFSTTLVLLLFIIVPYVKIDKNELSDGNSVAEVEPKTEILPEIVEQKPEIKPVPKIVVEKTEEGVNAFVAVEAKEELIASNTIPETESSNSIENEMIAPVVEEVEQMTVNEEVYRKPVKNVEGDWLTLHGISWSDNPERRMAVINSTMAREGRMIEGVRVVRIDRKSVVIEKDGEELLLSFSKY